MPPLQERSVNILSKPEIRAQVVALRREGWTFGAIAVAEDIPKSTARDIVQIRSKSSRPISELSTTRLSTPSIDNAMPCHLCKNEVLISCQNRRFVLKLLLCAEKDGLLAQLQ